MSVNIRRICVAFGIACLMSGAPALATPDDRSTSVKIGDLDLATASGQRMLDVRVARAARMVCDGIFSRDLRTMSEATACRRTAIANARPQVEQAIASARNGTVYAAVTTGRRSE